MVTFILEETLNINLHLLPCHLQMTSARGSPGVPHFHTCWSKICPVCLTGLREAASDSRVIKNKALVAL